MSKLKVFCFGFGQVAESFINKLIIEKKDFDLSITSRQETHQIEFNNLKITSFFFNNDQFDDTLKTKLEDAPTQMKKTRSSVAPRLQTSSHTTGLPLRVFTLVAVRVNAVVVEWAAVVKDAHLLGKVHQSLHDRVPLLHDALAAVDQAVDRHGRVVVVLEGRNDEAHVRQK